MKNVLIAIDYDPTAQKVAELGFEFASKLKAHVSLLHVVSNEVYYSSRAYSPIMGFTGFVPVEAMDVEQGARLKEAAQSYLEKTRNHLGEMSIETIVIEGDFAESIIETAKNINADVIVIGSHSRRWLEKIVMGSVTEQVLKNSKIPVLIIPTRNDEDEES